MSHRLLIAGLCAGVLAIGARAAAADPPARTEIQTWIVSPLDRTRAVEFRGAVPNPFRSETAIRFALPSDAHVTLKLFDVSGRLVRGLVDAQMPAGDHSALLSGRDLKPGTYFAVLRVGSLQTSRTVVFTR